MEMSPKEFRSNANYVARMREIFSDPVLQLWLEAMDTENPVRRVAPVDITPHGAYIMLGEQTGYNQYKERFLLGAQGIDSVRDDPGPQSYAEPAPLPED